jgi:hypothetical protein
MCFYRQNESHSKGPSDDEKMYPSLTMFSHVDIQELICEVKLILNRQMRLSGCEK